MGRRRRHIVTRNLGERRMDIIPRVNQRGALAVWVTPRLFLIEVVRFRVHSLFARFLFDRRIINGLFPFTARRA